MNSKYLDTRTVVFSLATKDANSLFTIYEQQQYE